MREIFRHNYSGAKQNIAEFLKGRIPKIGLKQLDNLFYQKNIKINAESVSEDYWLKTGDLIEVFWPYQENRGEINPRYFPLDLLYEDEDFLVINKAPGMACHHGLGIKNITLVDAVNFYLNNKNESPELENGLVHRLDKATSGLILFAKKKSVLEELKKCIQEDTSLKIYHALVNKMPEWQELDFNCKMGRDPENEFLIRVFREEEGLGKFSRTQFKVLGQQEEGVLIQAQIYTGLTHQIRVQLHYLNYPIIGDPRYGNEETKSNFRMMLHAQKLLFKYKGQDFEFESKADWKNPSL